MTTFVLKKYDAAKDPSAPTPVADPAKEKPQEQEEGKRITVRVSDSVAAIVANALYASLGKEAEIEEKKDEEQPVQALSTEDINKDPAGWLNSVKKNSDLLVVSRGFHTAKEEWFLSNLEQKGSVVHYSVESFVQRIACLLRS